MLSQTSSRADKGEGRGQDLASYKDQSDFFYDDPLKYISNRFEPSVRVVKTSPHDLDWAHTWPSRLVFFEALLASGRANMTVGKYLAARGYVEIWRSFNAHFHEDPRRRGDVLVWKRKSAAD